MRRSRWAVISFVFATAVGIAAGAATGKDADKSDKKTKPGVEKPSNAPPGVTLNACGCYAKGNGCVCTNKKAKCECPGECEPAGCDEKRNKELEKEYSEAVKHAQDDDKKREEAAQKKVQDAEKKRQADEAAAEKQRAEEEAAANPSNDESAASPPADEEKPAAKTKKSAKDSKKK
jgi:hypothetical protein